MSLKHVTRTKIINKNKTYISQNLFHMIKTFTVLHHSSSLDVLFHQLVFHPTYFQCH